MIQIEVAARTHIGHVRPENQDACFVAQTLLTGLPDAQTTAIMNADTLPCLVAGLADGIGGHPGGAEASRIALQSIMSSPGHDRATLTAAFLQANALLYTYAEQRPEKAGMGTTAAVMSACTSRLEFYNVGDSFIAQITPRFVRPLMRSVESICESSVLETALGGSPTFMKPSIEYVVLDCAPGRYVFATDGIVRYSCWDTMREILIDASVAPLETLQHIFELVLRGKALDNATCVLIEVSNV